MQMYENILTPQIFYLNGANIQKKNALTVYRQSIIY